MSLLRNAIGMRDRRVSRRQVLVAGAVAGLGTMVPHRGLAAVGGSFASGRSLSFFETHTRESLTTVYWAEGSFLPESLDQINYLLRDFRTGEIKAIDTRLLDLVYKLTVMLDAKRSFHVISGYRSPRTHALLHKRNKGVAVHSLHMHGKGIDLRLPGCPLPVLRRVAMGLKGGGVGYYPRSGFVHIDVGRVRYW